VLSYFFWLLGDTRLIQLLLISFDCVIELTMCYMSHSVFLSFEAIMCMLSGHCVSFDCVIELTM
jgi:hypothetical protein